MGEEVRDKETGVEFLSMVQTGGKGAVIKEAAVGMENRDVGWMVWKDMKREIWGLAT